MFYGETSTKERFHPHNAIDSKTWNTAVYARLSDEDRDKEYKNAVSQSIENQIAYIKEYVDYLNHSKNSTYDVMIHEVYTDDDFTGMNFQREGFERMMKAVKDGIIDCIIVVNLSRFGRYDTKMQDYLENKLEKSGREVRLIAIGDNYDSLYREVGMDIKFMLMMNREYSENQHRNVRRGMYSMQMQGKYVGAFAPYGYKKDSDDKHRFVVDPYAAEVVKRIFKLYLEGVSMKEIALMLTKEGIVNRTTYKKMQASNYVCSQKISEKEVHWTTDAIKNVLTNEVYTGILVQGKKFQKRLIDKKPTVVESEKWIRVENTHEAIITKEDWMLARSLMKKIGHDTTKPDEITLFKGVLKCGDCHHAMRKRWDKHTTKQGETHKYLYYNCGTFRDFSKNTRGLTEEEKAFFPKCTSHYISDNLLRQIVLSDVNTIISQLQNLEQAVKLQMSSVKEKSYRESVQAEIAWRKKNIETINKRLKTARTKWLDNHLDDAEYTDFKKECKDSMEQYEKEIASLERTLNKPQAVLENAWVNNLLQYGHLTELDRAAVIHLIDRIYVFQDKHIEIVYKFSEEFDSLFIKEV